MKIIGIIPARFASTRFPGKPLVEIAGRSMIQRVYVQAVKSQALQRVVVATDDQRIYDHVRDFGGEVVMTSTQHQSGTDRCAEALLGYPDFDGLINIQGDEPYIDPTQIDLLAACLARPHVSIATLIKKISHVDELLSRNTPKVVVGTDGQALYFSRQAIPFFRGEENSENWLDAHTYFKHIGIYGFRTELMQKLTTLPLSSLERAEGLEQLRWLEHGFSIHTAETTIETQAIDVPEDLERLKK